jgi:hypothetical protein
MNNTSFFDEGLVAAASGALPKQNPYEVGTTAHDEWRRGFLSYGTIELEVAKGDEIASDDGRPQ